MRALVIACFVFAACAPATVDGAIDLDGTEWTLAAIGGQPPVAGSTVTLRFAEGRASGSGGCNQFGGPYTVSGSKIDFGALASTRRACLSEEMNRQETAYFRALDEAATYEASATRLVLRDSAGATLVELTRSQSASR
jgi:heat shock protein HslJ